jgi:hypothetical protein
MRFRDGANRVDHRQIGEMEMTNHIEEAAAELDVAEHYTKYEMVVESHMESAKAHALIAIAQQLRIINLIKMNKVVVREGTRIGPSFYIPGDKPDHLRPDVVEALGIKEEK